MAEYKERFVAWPLLISGIVLALIGVVCLLWPGLAYGMAGMLVGFGFIVTGVSFLMMCFMPVIELATPLLALYAVFNFIIGVLFCANPIGSAISLVWLAFATLLVFAVINLIVGVTERGEGETRIGTNRIVSSVIAIVLAIIVMANPGMFVYLLAVMALVAGVWLIYRAIKAPRELIM